MLVSVFLLVFLDLCKQRIRVKVWTQPLCVMLLFAQRSLLSKEFHKDNRSSAKISAKETKKGQMKLPAPPPLTWLSFCFAFSQLLKIFMQPPHIPPVLENLSQPKPWPVCCLSSPPESLSLFVRLLNFALIKCDVLRVGLCHCDQSFLQYAAWNQLRSSQQLTGRQDKLLLWTFCKGDEDDVRCWDYYFQSTSLSCELSLLNNAGQSWHESLRFFFFFWPRELSRTFYS